MKTDDLIAALAHDVEPAPPHAVARRIGVGIALGAVLSTAILFLWLGVRPDLMPAMATGPFWMKFAYVLSLAALGFGLIDRLARPDGDGAVFAKLIIVPMVVMAALAVYQLAGASGDLRLTMLLGGSYRVCALNIVIVSSPVFVGVIWAMRSLAPTRLALAGAAAGVLAGAVGAFIYAFHCTEVAAPFMSIWYTMGIALVGIVGALLGRSILRW